MLPKMPRCPYCGGRTAYAKREAFDLGMSETPIDCIDGCGKKNVGYRDHDCGDFVMDRTARTEQST